MSHTVIDRPEDIAHLRRCTLKQGLKLEIMGMKRHGRSCYSIIKEEFGLSGSRQKVLEQFTKLIEKQRPTH